jgi:hypothetical protein
VLSLGVIPFFVAAPQDWLAFFTRLFSGAPGSAHTLNLWTFLAFATPLLAFDLLEEFRFRKRPLYEWPLGWRCAWAGGLVFLILISGATETHEFVYFQF